jgi:hypothetical protein
MESLLFRAYINCPTAIMAMKSLNLYPSCENARDPMKNSSSTSPRPPTMPAAMSSFSPSKRHLATSSPRSARAWPLPAASRSRSYNASLRMELSRRNWRVGRYPSPLWCRFQQNGLFVRTTVTGFHNEMIKLNKSSCSSCCYIWCFFLPMASTIEKPDQCKLHCSCRINSQPANLVVFISPR